MLCEAMGKRVRWSVAIAPWCLGACLNVPAAGPDTEGEASTSTTVGTSSTGGTSGASVTSVAESTGAEASTTGGSTDATPGTTISFSAASTDLPAGATIEVTATVTPPGIVSPGQIYSIATDVGVIRWDGSDAWTLDLAFDENGEVTFGLRVPVDTALDSQVTLDAGSLAVEGDSVFTVVNPTLDAVDVGGDQYEVARGFELVSILQDAAGQMELLGRASQLALPQPGSGFPPVPHIVSPGTPPDFYRLEGDALEFISAAPGLPDEGITQIGFADPEGPHGDLLFVCSASGGGGDGVFTIDPAGEWSNWVVFNNCNGMTLDVDEALDTTSFDDPVYLNISSEAVERYDPAMATEPLLAGLPIGSSGYRLFVNDQPPFETGLYMLFVGVSGPATDGALLRTGPAQAGGWMDPTTELAGLGGPRDLLVATGTDFGSLMYIFLQTDGELRAFRADGSSFVVARGFEGEVSFELDALSNMLWLIEGGRGKIFTLGWL